MIGEYCMVDQPGSHISLWSLLSSWCPKSQLVDWPSDDWRISADYTSHPGHPAHNLHSYTSPISLALSTHIQWIYKINTKLLWPQHVMYLPRKANFPQKGYFSLSLSSVCRFNKSCVSWRIKQSNKERLLHIPQLIPWQLKWCFSTDFLLFPHSANNFSQRQSMSNVCFFWNLHQWPISVTLETLPQCHFLCLTYCMYGHQIHLLVCTFCWGKKWQSFENIMQ